MKVFKSVFTQVMGLESQERSVLERSPVFVQPRGLGSCSFNISVAIKLSVLNWKTVSDFTNKSPVVKKTDVSKHHTFLF